MRMFCSWKTALACGFLAAGFLLATATQQAQARPYFLKWWLATYPEVSKTNEVSTKVKCDVCHVGKSKKNRNDYGKALDKAIGKKLKSNAKDKEAFEEALKKVEGEKSKVEGKTFGDLLKANQLPSNPK